MKTIENSYPFVSGKNASFLFRCNFYVAEGLGMGLTEKQTV